MLPIRRVLEWGFQLGVSQFCMNLGQNCLFVIITVPIFFCGQDNLPGGQFWAMGRFNLLGGQSNLLDGQMPTQLTCYLPPCIWIQQAVENFIKGRVNSKNEPNTPGYSHVKAYGDVPPKWVTFSPKILSHGSHFTKIAKKCKISRFWGSKTFRNGSQVAKICGKKPSQISGFLRKKNT